MKTLNLGIVAHVDAGKTSLTERLLHAAGVIDTLGRVDDGSTQTDTLALERQRGITIKSAVVSFTIAGVTVNLIDTPGHPDFIAEVERVLSVLDGAVLVISAVEGVQAQTRVLMRALRRLRIPTLIFVNKIDRRGARGWPVLDSVSARLTPAIVPMGTVSGLGTRAAAFVPCGEGDAAFTARLADLLADTLGVPRTTPGRHQFAPPTLETVVVARRRADRGALHLALTQLAEQDPLINLRLDELHHDILVSLYGEVQKEVIQATLASDFGIDAGFRGTTTLCIERPAGTGAAVEIGKTPPNPFLATVGLRIEPGRPGSGVQFRLGIELGSLPFSFLKAIEETVHRTLRQGLHGWQVTDCVVTLTRSGYWPRQSHAHATFDKSMSSTAGNFRNLTPLVVMSALRQAASTVHEPVHQFRLEIPADTATAVLPVLAQLRAIPWTSDTRAALCTVEGEIPAARVPGLEQQLPGLTRGEGVLDCTFARYQEVRGVIPERPRADHNPLNRKEYLLSAESLRARSGGRRAGFRAPVITGARRSAHRRPAVRSRAPGGQITGARRSDHGRPAVI